MTTRVLLVDDHELLRQGVAATLNPEDDFEVVGEASSSAEAIGLPDLLSPDMILLDVFMPGGSGLDGLPALREKWKDSKIVMLTVSEDAKAVTYALNMGANGYIVKGTRAAALLRALRTVADGQDYVSPEIAGHILRNIYGAPAETSGIESLSPREVQVLGLLALGRTNREIADELVISERTVKRHVSAVLTKLRARNRTEAAMQLQKRGGSSTAPAE